MIKLNKQPIQFKHFNDGSLRLKLTLPYDIYSGIDIPTITWLYDNDEEISQLFFLTNYLQQQLKIKYIILEMPYINSARMDRIKNPDECFTLKYFCNFINSLNFYKVKVFDPHSYVSTALLNNVETYSPHEEIDTLLQLYKNATLFFCDEGGMKRYKDIIGDMYFAFGVKDREWSTQDINSLQVLGAKHMITGHDILICDDILSRGSTLYLAAKQLKEMGANNIYVWISHTENTVLQPHINGQSLLNIPNLITKVYTTNSIFRGEHDKIEIIKEF